MMMNDQENHEQCENADWLSRLETDLLSGPNGIRVERLESLDSGSHNGTGRLAFWRWNSAVIRRFLEHPEMQADAEPVMVPDLDSGDWEEDFIAGVTVDEMVETANAVFVRGGW